MPKKVVIIGGGFAGINVALALKKMDADIVLIDRTNHHAFQPLLYQVATSALSVGNIASPLREILRDQPNVSVIMDLVENIDLDKKTIETHGQQTFHFDTLVVAPGARHSYFGHHEWEKYAPGLKTVADAVKIREKILFAFEEAENSSSDEEAEKFLTFVVIGAGPTGVEMAGSIAEFAHRTLLRNFRKIDPAKSKIYLIEGTGQVLPSYPLKLAQAALKNLEDLGITVLLNTMVTEVTKEGIFMGERFLPTHTVVWAAGNEASPLLRCLKVPLDKQGRVLVEPDLSIPGHPNVFVIGDSAACKDSQGKFLPGIAPVAIQEARYVAHLIKSDLPPAKRKPFRYFDKGYMATIGRGKAVAVIRKLKFSGFIAWLMWGFIHIFYLISFRHRLFVMTQWLFLYLMHIRPVRVITRSIEKIP